MTENINNTATPGNWSDTGYRAGRSGTGLASGGIVVGESGSMGTNEHGQPVSRDWLAAQGQAQAMQQAVQQGYDPSTQTHGVMHGVNVEADPDRWLRMHGVACIDAHGRDCTPSPAQARGLVQALLRAQAMNTEHPEAVTSISFIDDSLPPKYARAYGRRIG